MFELDQEVTWDSQSSGVTSTKKGRVVWIVEDNTESPYDIWKREFQDHKRMFKGATVPGGQYPGYLISVPDGDTRKPKLYCPYPNLLAAVLPKKTISKNQIKNTSGYRYICKKRAQKLIKRGEDVRRDMSGRWYWFRSVA